MLGIYTAVKRGGCGVATVHPNTPAAAAGMKPGDVITHIGARTISRFEDLIQALLDKDPGDDVTVTFIRGKQTIRKKIRLMRRKQFPR